MRRSASISSIGANCPSESRPDVAKCCPIAAWSSDRMLTVKRGASLMASCDPDCRSTLNKISGGSTETLVNDPIVIPRGSSLLKNVITVTGDGTYRITRLNPSPVNAPDMKLNLDRQYEFLSLRPVHVRASFTRLKNDF